MYETDVTAKAMSVAIKSW